VLPYLTGVIMQITVFNSVIRIDQNDRYCLNDIHKAAMASGLATKDHNPARFLRNDSVKEFIEVIDLESQNPPSIETRKGRGITGTYATQLIALRYAGWISAKVEVEVYRTFQKVVNHDEQLTGQLIEAQTDPEAQKRLAARAQGMLTRHLFTDALKAHGVTGSGFAACTNAIYQPLFGGTAKEIKAVKGLPERANLREHMSRLELVAAMFAEEVAMARIEQHEANGNQECKRHSFEAAKETKAVIK